MSGTRDPQRCFHGGAFFSAIGEQFDALGQSTEIVNADVLDAWFPPSPKVLEALSEYLPWILRTSPPTDCGGMLAVLAATRGVDEDCLLAGAGSSALIFLAFSKWLDRDSRVLLLDPTYGEYPHVLANLVGCHIDRFTTSRESGYAIDLEELAAALQGGYDLVILVNPITGAAILALRPRSSSARSEDAGAHRNRERRGA